MDYPLLARSRDQARLDPGDDRGLAQPLEPLDDLEELHQTRDLPGPADQDRVAVQSRDAVGLGHVDDAGDDVADDVDLAESH